MAEETQVTTAPETPAAAPAAPKSFREHYEAVKSAQSSKDQAAPPAGDDTPEAEQPAQEPEKVADEPPDTTPDPDAILTAAELAALPPKERANAEKWQAKLTQKAQALAAQSKEFEEWKPLIDSLKTNPKATLEQMAEQLGVQIAKQDTTPTTAEVVTSELPEEWKFLQPVFESLEKRVEARVRAELAPIKEAHTQIVTEAAAAETESAIKAFDAKFPDWRKHEAQMLEIGKKFIPTAGAMTDFEYMETLYKLATADIKKAEQVKATVKQINKSAAAAETPTPGISDSRVEHALPPPEKRSMRDAYNAAKQGIVWTK